MYPPELQKKVKLWHSLGSAPSSPLVIENVCSVLNLSLAVELQCNVFFFTLVFSALINYDVIWLDKP
jgi:hypothetical protein